MLALYTDSLRHKCPCFKFHILRQTNFRNKYKWNWKGWLAPIIPTFGRLMQEDHHKLEAGYGVRFVSKNKNQNHISMDFQANSHLVTLFLLDLTDCSWDTCEAAKPITTPLTPCSSDNIASSCPSAITGVKVLWSEAKHADTLKHQVSISSSWL